MSKLLTVGCSYTFYKWQTWADYLAKNFTNATNKGIPGADNATIARTLVALAEPEDTVAVMWSSYHRYNHKISYADMYNYSENHLLRDKYYFTNIFNPFERFLTTLDYIQWVTVDSQIRGYKLYQFSAFPFLLGEMHTPVTPDIKQLIAEKQFFINKIMQPSLETYSEKDLKEQNDSHPIPESHYKFYRSIVCPAMGINPL